LRISLIIFALPLLIMDIAYAWNAVGHRATALIALEQMTDLQQKQMGEILRAHPRYEEDFVAAIPERILKSNEEKITEWLFSQAAVWPDIARGLSPDLQETFSRFTWHFINVPIWLTAEDQVNLEDGLAHNQSLAYPGELVTGLNVIQALPGNLAVWRDPSSSQSEKAVALCWILHLVGDLHQPLHSGTLFSQSHFPLGDRGGNSIKVKKGSGTSNLHSIWDSLPTSILDFAPEPHTIRLQQADQVDHHSVMQWLEDHVNLARTFVYTEAVMSQIAGLAPETDPVLIKLPDGYEENARPIARQQIYLAGHRIAKLLK